nr:hypothetical protein [Tanacetum cinerariifolium]
DPKIVSVEAKNVVHQEEEEEVKNVVEQPAERGNHNIQSLQNFRVVHKSSISLNTSQISSIHAVAPILSTKEPEYSSSMGYEHLSITPEMKFDEVTESNAKNLLPIPSECEVTLEDKRECDVPISENSPICDNHSEIFPDSNNDDDISVYDDDFEDIEYVEASLSDPKIVSVEAKNVVHQEEEEVDLEDISSLSDNFSPKFKTFCDYTEETRSGNTTHADNSLPNMIRFALRLSLIRRGDIRFLEELLIDDFILSHESSDSNFEDNPSISRPPPEPPDAETDAGEEISVVMNDKDKFDEDYYFFMIDKVFSFLSIESEDTIFDP